MMKSKKLLLVTAAYPYGHGESFITAELPHLADFLEVELVPCSHTPGAAPRQVTQEVNLEYTNKRWGWLRAFHLISSFALGLMKYRWLDDARYIIRRQHKFENLKELARALYRAHMFESFLAAQSAKNKKEFDLVYFYWMVPEIMGAIGFRQSSHPALKIVARAHGGDLYDEVHTGGYFGLRDSIAAGIDKIYCISHHGKAYLENKYSFTEETVHLARLGVNDPGYLNAQPEDDDLSIVSCAFVTAGKRLHLIVQAINYLLDRQPDLKIKWTHIGDGELFEQLRAQVSDELGDRANVIFTGYLAPSQVMDLYRDQRFDVIVNVSDTEGIPVSLMEASSTGIPMVATDVGGNGEIVNAGNGVLIPADADIEAIALALIRFKDRALAAAYRKRARSDWEERFNARTNFSKFGRDLIRALGSPLKSQHATASVRQQDCA
jgi:glycosyltransferase involved in cell wall biosynthesis